MNGLIQTDVLIKRPKKILLEQNENKRKNIFRLGSGKLRSKIFERTSEYSQAGERINENISTTRQLFQNSFG